MVNAEATPQLAVDEVSGVTADTQEVRLATTMTGGVSLAVWMGGVAREIDLLMQASKTRRRLQPTPRRCFQGRGRTAPARSRRGQIAGADGR